MTTWDDLNHELSLWRQRGADVSFWWRDDDAIEPTQALDRLVGLSLEHAVPCALAVVPDKATPALAGRLRDVASVFPVQHGFRHLNHAPKGEKAAEFGVHRNQDELRDELRDGWRKLAGFANLVPVFVPPWNRMSEDLKPVLAELGIRGVSQHGPRRAARVGGGLSQVNTHADIINWRTIRGFVGTEKALSFVLSHLRDRRLGRVDREEPTGLLTHHLDHDGECWTFMENLFRWTSRNSNVRWLTPLEVFDIDAAAREMDT